jgi:uroporphyrinogen-III decarboxylase
VLARAGLTMGDGFHDPQKFAHICEATHELFGFDNVMLGWGDLITEARALGSTWRFTDRDFYPRIDHYALRNISDVDALAPVDPWEDEFWSVPPKTGEIILRSLGREDAVAKIIDLYGQEPGLIIAPGCEVPFKSPVENMVMLRESCIRFGTY